MNDYPDRDEDEEEEEEESEEEEEEEDEDDDDEAERRFEEELRREMEAARAQVNALVEERIPGLVRLKLERAIKVDRHFVRDVTFAKLSDGGERRALELKLVLGVRE